MLMQLHSPSEHQIDGKAFDAEVQFVNSYDEKHAIISYMFDVQDGNQERSKNFIDELLKSFISSSEGSESTADDEMIDFGEFFEDVDTVNFYHYVGSETAPPCMQGVDYYVMKQI